MRHSSNPQDEAPSSDRLHAPTRNDPDGRFSNVATPTGMVHLGRVRDLLPPYGRKMERWLVPACAVGRSRAVRYLSPTDRPVSCRACLAVVERRIAASSAAGESHPFRANPPVSRAPTAIRRVARKIGLSGKPLGCGAYGCVYPGKGGWVRKVTKDETEVRMVRAVQKVRKSRATATSEAREALADVGTTPERVASLPGIVAYRGSPKRLSSGAWAYEREDVEPIDARYGSEADRRLARVGKALERWFYGKQEVSDAAAFLCEHPELRLIIQTAVYLDLVRGLVLEDVHEYQVGRVIRSSNLHKKGDYVLYDGAM